MLSHLKLSRKNEEYKLWIVKLRGYLAVLSGQVQVVYFFGCCFLLLPYWDEFLPNEVD